MTYAFVRQFSGEESLSAQRAQIVEYALGNGLSIDSEMMEFESAGKPLGERRSFRDFLNTLSEGDTVIVERVETLGRDIEEVIVVVNCLLSRNISLVIAHSGIEIDESTRLLEILPLIMRLKKDTRERAGDNRVGRPKGRKSASKFDSHLPEILAGLKSGRSVSFIARKLDVSRSSLKDYIESRSLRQILEDSHLKAKARKNAKRTLPDPKLKCTLEERRSI